VERDRHDRPPLQRAELGPRFSGYAPALLILNLISHILFVWYQGKIILEDSKHSSLWLEFLGRLRIICHHLPGRRYSIYASFPSYQMHSIIVRMMSVECLHPLLDGFTLFQTWHGAFAYPVIAFSRTSYKHKIKRACT
jgi:hypothetical protein